MKNALQFLTEMGSSLRLRQMSRSELKAAMDAAGIDDELQVAVLDNDTDAIVEKLRTSGDIICLIAPDRPDEDEDDSEEQGAPNEVRYG